MSLELTVTAVTAGLVGAFGVWSFRRRTARARDSATDPAQSTRRMQAPPVVSEGADLWLGKTVGGYLLGEKVGEGGMAFVYKARSQDGTRDLAVKVLREPYASEPAFRRRIAREIETCCDLRHPNIVTLEDWSRTEDETLFLALEYVGGPTLQDRLRPDGLALEEVWPLLQGLIAGLSYAHQRGIVHRDLKPENIMLTAANDVKIADFGLARNQEGDKITKTGDSLGTPAYFPPEQITGAPPTPAADQYSLGVMLYEMLTGRRPFTERDPMKLLMCHLSEPPTDPLVHKPDMNPTLAAVVLRMLEKKPESRFTDLEVIAEAVGALYRGQPWEMPAVVAAEVTQAPAVLPRFQPLASEIEEDSTVGFQREEPS